MEFRQEFKCDVVIDMFCYRRFGHNEGDEPAFTQPLMYRKIRSHASILELYSKRLIADGIVTEADVDGMRAAWRATASSRSRRATSPTRPTGSTDAGPGSRPCARTLTTRAGDAPASPSKP